MLKEKFRLEIIRLENIKKEREELVKQSEKNLKGILDGSKYGKEVLEKKEIQDYITHTLESINSSKNFIKQVDARIRGLAEIGRVE